MHPVLFVWRSTPVYSYTAMMYVGLVLGILAAHRLAPWASLDASRVYVATLLLVLPTLFGSRLLYVATHWRQFRHHRRAIFRRSADGGALYGGLALSLLVSVPLLALLGLPFGAFWDIGAVTLLVATACTRVGCLLHGCCAGRETSGWLALRVRDRHGRVRRRVPTQLLEAALLLVVAAGALAAWDSLAGRGGLFLAASAAYGVGRGALETTRADVHRIGAVSSNQMISGALVVVALLLLLVLRWAPAW